MAEQDYDGSGRVQKGASNGGGAYRPPPSRRGMGAMTDDSSGDERNDRKRSRPKANSLAVRTARSLWLQVSILHTPCPIMTHPALTRLTVHVFTHLHTSSVHEAIAGYHTSARSYAQSALMPAVGNLSSHYVQTREDVTLSQTLSSKYTISVSCAASIMKSV